MIKQPVVTIGISADGMFIEQTTFKPDEPKIKDEHVHEGFVYS